MDNLGLAEHEYRMASDNVHPKAEINKKMQLMKSYYHQLDSILHNRAYIKALRDKNKTMDSIVTIDETLISDGKLPETNTLPDEVGGGIIEQSERPSASQ